MKIEPTLDLDTLMARHQADIWRFLRVMGCECNEADDLTQETFIAVMRKPFEQRGDESTAAYLRKVARNLFLMARRRLKNAPRVHNLDDIDRDWARFAGDDGGHARIDALVKCIEGLEARARLALKLRYDDGAGRGEIARAIELSEGGAKNLMERARRQLKHCVEKRLNQ